jgi:hypothetical protein
MEDEKAREQAGDDTPPSPDTEQGRPRDGEHFAVHQKELEPPHFDGDDKGVGDLKGLAGPLRAR